MKKPIKFNQVATFPKNLFSRDWLCFRSYPFTYGVFCTQLGLTLHAQALLKYSFDTEDYQLANEAKYILTRLEALDTETEARLNEWELTLEGAVTPVSVTLPLVADTPVSKYHYAVSKRLALKEFGITTDGVDLAYAFLQCSEKQVTLVTAARSAWVIPDDWEACGLTLLSDEPTKATITEYPDGYVDRNGSVII